MLLNMKSEIIKDRLLWIVIFLPWLFIVYLPSKFIKWEKDTRKVIYNFITKIDPPPKIKKKENIKDWLKRINLKYAIREVEYMKLNSYNLDYDEHEEFIKTKCTKKSEEKDMRTLARLSSIIDTFNQECYRMVMDRKEIEEQLDNNAI